MRFYIQEHQYYCGIDLHAREWMNFILPLQFYLFHQASVGFIVQQSTFIFEYLKLSWSLHSET